MKKNFFSLDIGTRKVMGIVSRLSEDDVTEIVDVEVVEHASRPMFDGQIHSIEEVAKTARKIKRTLETRLQTTLTDVGIAVAGRNLTAYKSRAMREFPMAEDITQEIIRDLELEAIDRIASDSGANLSQYYCVGYSPVYYELDGARIANLVGHRAMRSIAVEVIATFLPRIVLDSMFAVLERAGLTATDITLEPISAINAIVPAEMRRLNIVLVDIGAGTSDLALTRDGHVFAYGMVSEAGDEITEAISELLLTDFTVAEQIKRSLTQTSKIQYSDIWGRNHWIESDELKEKIRPTVRTLAESIAKMGLDLNGGAPQAVMVVGGGSLTSGLVDELATAFGISADRVGIRLPSAIRDLKDLTNKILGPETITPLGITLMTMKSMGLRFVNVEVNGTKVRMLDFQQKKDVMGALTLAGVVSNKKLYARPGLALSVEVDGEIKVIKGSLGVPAQVSLNGQPVASLSDKINDGDRLDFVQAVDGKDAIASVADLVAPMQRRFSVNRQDMALMVPIYMNGEKVYPDTPVTDRAAIKVGPLTVRDALQAYNVKAEQLSERQVLIHMNGVPKILTQRSFSLWLNGSTTELDSPVNENDAIEFRSDAPTYYRIRDIIAIPQEFEKIHISVDGKDIEVTLESVQVFMNGQRVRADEFVIDGADIQVYYVQDKRILLSEIFKYIEFDPYRGLGKTIKIFVDDAPAGFTTPLSDGARVKIHFEDR